MAAEKMIGRVEDKVNLAGNFWLIRIGLPGVANFLPGQFVSLRVNEEGQRRSYSVASLPRSASIELVVDITPMGVGCKYILGLKVGDSVELLGFLGNFVVSEQILATQKEMLFVGIGCGVVPLKPMIEDLLRNKKFKGRVCLLWGMRYESDLFWMKEFDKLEDEFGNFHLEMVLSKPNESWSGKIGHVGDVIGGLGCEWKSTTAFLCGNPEMITEMKERLLGLGVPGDQVIHEQFA